MYSYCVIVEIMSLLSEYRIRIKSLLAADDIQQVLLLEGVGVDVARAVGISKAVIAQKSLVRRETLEVVLSPAIPDVTKENKQS